MVAVQCRHVGPGHRTGRAGADRIPRRTSLSRPVADVSPDATRAVEQKSLIFGKRATSMARPGSLKCRLGDEDDGNFELATAHLEFRRCRGRTRTLKLSR